MVNISFSYIYNFINNSLNISNCSELIDAKIFDSEKDITVENWYNAISAKDLNHYKTAISNLQHTSKNIKISYELKNDLIAEDRCGVINFNEGWPVIAGTVTIKPKVNEETVKELPTDSDNTNHRYKILFVEDQTLILTTAGLYLRSHGYDVITAENGQIAIDLYLENSKEIDLVILDCKLPIKNGDEVLSTILNDNKDLPVIMTSGHSKAIDGDKWLERGAKAYLEKPFNLETLKNAIEKLLT